MKLYRRLNSLILVIIVLTSVFLLFSCGEPSYCDLTNTKIERFTKDQTTSTEFSFSVSCLDSDIEKVKNGPGLVIGYIALDKSILNGDPQLVIDGLVNNSSYPYYYLKDQFNEDSEYGLQIYNDVILRYNWVYSSPSNIDLIIKSPIITDEANINKSHAGSPVYHWNINSSSTFTKDFTVKLEDVTTDNTKISITDENGIVKYYLLDNKNKSELQSNEFVLFASMSSGTGEFSNFYFSTLVNIGYIDVTSDSINK